LETHIGTSIPSKEIKKIKEIMRKLRIIFPHHSSHSKHFDVRRLGQLNAKTLHRPLEPILLQHEEANLSL
jgi:hypothetical protein